MEKSRAVHARTRAIKSYALLTGIFVLLFGGMTLLSIFISRLG
jgi:intracellular septation protein A